MTQKEPTTIRWAAPVRRDRIRRLYETDARGLTDEDLIEDVGCALYLRCRSILTATAAVRGQVDCPYCGGNIRRTEGGNSARSFAEILLCADCGWQLSWGDYWRSFAGRQLLGGGATWAFESFLMAFDAARSAREKLLAIDRLIHSFHHNAKTQDPGRPAGANLLEGSLAEVVVFLDTLTYGEATAPELRQTRADYARRMSVTWAGKRYLGSG